TAKYLHLIISNSSIMVNKQLGSLLFVGSILVGTGLGFVFGAIPEGPLFGTGLGFALLALPELMSPEGRKKPSVGNLMFVASILIGTGLGFIFRNIPAGALIGVGVGFGFRALPLLIERDRHLEEGARSNEEEKF
ncbi:MAG: DUF1761 domain-containing protein, partial [Bacteroidota bacterium]